MAANEEMANTYDRITGSLINAVLGALILWVGQTTFRHAGVLAGVDEKIVGINHKFEDVEKRQEGMKKWLENAVTDMKDSTRTQFKLSDGDKLITQLRQAEQAAIDLERRFAERIAALDLKLASLETQHKEFQQTAALKAEITQLRSDLTRAAVAQEVQYQSGDRFARGPVPVYLPPVDSRR